MYGIDMHGTGPSPLPSRYTNRLFGGKGEKMTQSELREAISASKGALNCVRHCKFYDHLFLEGLSVHAEMETG